MTDEIKIVAYDSRWTLLYEEERDRLRSALGPAIHSIEHVGSTSVPGLGAKPIIDIMIGAGQVPPEEKHVATLLGLGYSYRGEFGVAGRHFFEKGSPRTHHLHWVEPEGDFWRKQILFREFVRAHPEEAKKYEDLKRDLALLHLHDREGYTRAKTRFVEGVLDQAQAWHDRTRP